MDNIGPKNVLIIDAYNMIHRCRFNWGGGDANGDNQIFYNFVKLFKSTVEDFPSELIYFVLDGKPLDRLNKSPDYKANRIKEDLSESEEDYWLNFSTQKRAIINFITRNLPVTTVYHPNSECDDIIFNLIKYRHTHDNVVVISNDSDFIQLLNKFPDNIKVWNPMKKGYADNTEYDYVSWKAMVGDRSDNIMGVKGVGKKTAAKVLETPGMLEEKMLDESFKKQYNNSYGLIEFLDFNNDWNDVEFTLSDFKPSQIEGLFSDLEFNSLLRESYWNKFKEVFNTL